MSKKEVAKEFPMTFLEEGKANELRSRFTLVSVAGVTIGYDATVETADGSVQPDQPSYDTTVETTDASPSVGLSYETEVA